MLPLRRPLFLHFAAGEVRELLNVPRDRGRFERALKVLILGTDVPLYIPISALWENVGISASCLDFCRVAMDHDHLHTIGSTGVVDEFLETHARLYAHDRDRYPNYFDKRRIQRLRRFPTTIEKPIDTTASLESALEAWVAAEAPLGDQHSPSIQLELSLRTIISRALSEREGEAITYSYFRNYIAGSGLPHASAEAYLRRKIFVEYVSHYLAFDGADIATGWPGLDRYERPLATDFPVNDLLVLGRIVRGLGLKELVDRPWHNHRAAWELLMEKRGGGVHVDFVELIRGAISGVMESLLEDSNGTAQGSVAVRDALRQILDSSLPGDEPRKLSPRPERRLLERVTRSLEQRVRDMKLRPDIGRAISRRSDLLRALRCDVLILTSTSVERDEVLEAFQRHYGLQLQYLHGQIDTYFDLGTVSGARVVMVQSEMGAGGPGGSQATVIDALNAFNPSSVIAVGIAFGVDPSKQAIGQILVSTSIFDYELQRISTDAAGKLTIIPRGDTPLSSTRLLSRCKAATSAWAGAPVEFGQLLSGDKLVDNIDFRDEIRAFTNGRAIGGEMEGWGLFSSASRRKVDWIVMKAVCDYADGLKRVDKELRQLAAARSAATFAEYVLRSGGFLARGDYD